MTDVEVIVQSELSDDDPDRIADPDRWAALARSSLVTEGVSAGELNLIFIDTDAMTELNVEHMEGTGPTDVLAFPIDGEGVDAPDVGAGSDIPVLLGDVVICPAVARSYAAEHGRSVADELALLVVHGVLHVLGHDHAEPEETELMKAREEALLAAHHTPSPSPS